jgi:hypothetical protein
MTTTAMPVGQLGVDEARLAQLLVAWLETGERPVGLFADDAFADVSLPQWRLQGEGPAEIAAIRATSHPHPGKVTVSGLDRTSRGFLIEFQERWDAEGQRWYCRELLHCHVADGRVTTVSVYCTGDWDEDVQRRHAQQVRLTRP